MSFDPDEFLRKTEPSKNGFDPDEFLKKTGPKNEPGVVDTAIMQGLQGATAGFLDEISGGVEALGRVAGVKGMGGEFRDLGLSEEGPTLDLDKLRQAYFEARDRKRAGLKAQSEAHPVTAIASNIAGAVASPANRLAKGLSMAKGGATLGSLNALGYSEADDASGVAGDIIKGAALGGGIGKVAEKALPAIQSVSKKVANASAPTMKKMDAEKILEAAKRMDVDLTPGYLDRGGFVERMESSLARSPSIFGQSVARQRQNIFDRMGDKMSSLVKPATGLSPYQVGEKVKSGITSRVHERLDPISAVFDEVLESTKHIPIAEKSKNAVIRNIKKSDLFRLTGGSGKLREYVDMVDRATSANDVKTIMTMLNKDIQAAQGAEKMALGAIKEKLSTLEKNSIMRAAIQAAKGSGKSGESIGRGIVSDLRDARTAYRALAEDLTGVGEAARAKFKGGASQFLNAIDDIPSERVQDKLLSLGNKRQVDAIRRQFPDEFQLLREGRIKEIADAATERAMGGGERLSVQKFLNQVRKLEPEAKELLFPGGGQVIDDIATLYSNTPRNFNPSGTASERAWQDIIGSNIADAVRYPIYKAASTGLGDQVGRGLMSVPNPARAYAASPQAVQNLVGQASATSKSEIPDWIRQEINAPKMGDAKQSPQEYAKTRGDEVNVSKMLQSNPAAFGKFAKPLQDAYQRSGEQGVAATHFILQQQNPEYQEMLRSAAGLSD